MIHYKFYKIAFLLISSFLCLHSTGFAQGYTQTGKASFYASKFEGRKTASGEVFSNRKMTAAHRSLPFGSKVKVFNLENKKSVIVIINDRGPFIKNRIIDVSQLAARKLGFFKKGITLVKIELIDTMKK